MTWCDSCVHGRGTMDVKNSRGPGKHCMGKAALDKRDIGTLMTVQAERTIHANSIPCLSPQVESGPVRE